MLGELLTTCCGLSKSLNVDPNKILNVDKKSNYISRNSIKDLILA